MERMETPDAHLVDQTLSGNLESFGELHQRYFERVVRVVLRIVGNRERAEDLAQDAYTSALQSLPRLTAPERFYPWLCRIAVNRAIEGSRQQSRRARLRATWLPANGSAGPTMGAAPSGALDQMMEDERAATVHAALDRLPERQRAALVLRFFDGMSMRAIGDVLEYTEITARSNVFRGLRKLGAVLKENDHE